MPSNRRAVIIGGTGLIGLAIAEALGRDGLSVILVHHQDAGRAERALHKLRRQEIHSSVARADVRDEAAVERLFAGILSDGSIDVLVNAVGSFHFKPFLETSPAEWDEALSSNLRTAVLCCRAVLPSMRARGSGSIVNVASMNAQILRARPNTLPYAIAKAGVVLLTKTLAATEGPYGIRVNAVSPGFVRGADHSVGNAQRTIPLAREAEASEIGQAVRFLVSTEAAYVTGAVLDVHGGAFL